jgi:hypothetical protein
MSELDRILNPIMSGGRATPLLPPTPRTRLGTLASQGFIPTWSYTGELYTPLYFQGAAWADYVPVVDVGNQVGLRIIGHNLTDLKKQCDIAIRFERPNGKETEWFSSSVVRVYPGGAMTGSKTIIADLEGIWKAQAALREHVNGEIVTMGTWGYGTIAEVTPVGVAPPLPAPADGLPVPVVPGEEEAGGEEWWKTWKWPLVIGGVALVVIGRKK